MDAPATHRGGRGFFCMSETDRGIYVADEARWSALMASAQSGEEGDYRQLLSELSQVVSSYLKARMGGYDFIEDCVQEILIAVHEGRHTYQPSRKFRPWLFAIVRHKTIDAIRRQKSRSRVGELGVLDLESIPVVDNVDVSLTSGRLLAALPKPQRDAIMLTKIVGLSNAEAAAELLISKTAVKVRVHRGIASLRDMMELEDL